MTTFIFHPRISGLCRIGVPMPPRRHVRARGCTKVPTDLQVKAAAREIWISPIGGQRGGWGGPGLAAGTDWARAGGGCLHATPTGTSPSRTETTSLGAPGPPFLCHNWERTRLVTPGERWSVDSSDNWSLWQLRGREGCESIVDEGEWVPAAAPKSASKVLTVICPSNLPLPSALPCGSCALDLCGEACVCGAGGGAGGDDGEKCPLGSPDVHTEPVTRWRSRLCFLQAAQPVTQGSEVPVTWSPSPVAALAWSHSLGGREFHRTESPQCRGGHSPLLRTPSRGAARPYGTRGPPHLSCPLSLTCSPRTKKSPMRPIASWSLHLGRPETVR